MQIRVLLFLFSTCLLAACRLEIVVPAGGSVGSLSGAVDCPSGQSCTVQVNDVFFEQTFVGQAEAGQVFTGWKRGFRRLCGRRPGECPLTTASFDGNDALMAILESDQVFYLEPLFERAPGPLFNVRYCEVLLTNPESDRVVAEVYNTLGLNDCPQAAWEQLDSTTIAAEFGVAQALLNGPRFWVLDFIVNNAETDPVQSDAVFFGDLEMLLVATVSLPVDEALEESRAYQVAEVVRDTVFFFFAGRRIYELRDPDGNRYVMQSFSRFELEDQTIADLATLGDRLSLPTGWTFDTRILDADFELPTVDGIARVVTDEFANTYQRVP